MTLNELLIISCEVCDRHINLVKGKNRDRPNVECRIAFAYMAKRMEAIGKMQRYRLREISAEINRKHNNITHYLKYANDNIRLYPNNDLSLKIKQLETILTK
jgi:hypothetical protein